MHMYFKQAIPISLALAFSIYLIGLIPEHGTVYPQIINSGHAFVFFLANLLLLRFFLGHSGSRKHIIFISTCSVLIGVAIELIQPYFGRNRSLLDVFYDVVGVLFSVIVFTRFRTSTRSFKYCFTAGFLVIISAIPLFKYWLWWQVNSSSEILNFERLWEPLTYKASQSVTLSVTTLPTTLDQDSDSIHGNKVSRLNKVGQLKFQPNETYPGLHLDYPKQDWTQFNTLSWEVVSLNERPVTMNLRVHDFYHNNQYEDRFNYKFNIIPGLNVYEVKLNDIQHAPHSRKIDLAKIRSMKFFISKPTSDTTVYIDNLHLK